MPVQPLPAPHSEPTPQRRVRDALASAGIRRPRLMRGERTEIPFDAPMLATERLLLRPHTMSDAADWFALESEPAVTEFLPWPERDRRHSARHLHDRTRHTRLWQKNDFLALAIELDGRVIGDVSLHLREVSPRTRSVEIGWVLHPAHSGRGYATEAARAMLGFAFDVMGARQATAVTDARNIRSLALAERLGFAPLPSASAPPSAADAADAQAGEVRRTATTDIGARSAVGTRTVVLALPRNAMAPRDDVDALRAALRHRG